MRAAGRRQVSRARTSALIAEHVTLGRFRLSAGDRPDSRPPEFLFTENESNAQRLFGSTNESQYVKDAFHEYVVHNRVMLVNPMLCGTKAAAVYVLDVPGRREHTVYLRLTKESEVKAQPFRGLSSRAYSADPAKPTPIHFYAAKIPDRICRPSEQGR